MCENRGSRGLVLPVALPEEIAPRGAHGQSYSEAQVQADPCVAQCMSGCQGRGRHSIRILYASPLIPLP